MMRHGIISMFSMNLYHHHRQSSCVIPPHRPEIGWAKAFFSMRNCLQAMRQGRMGMVLTMQLEQLYAII